MSLCQAASCMIRVQAQNMIPIAARNPKTIGSLQLNLSNLNLKESIPKYPLIYDLNFNDTNYLFTVLTALVNICENVVDLATLEASWRVHFCSAIDLIEKFKFFNKAKSENGDFDLKSSVKVWSLPQVKNPGPLGPICVGGALRKIGQNFPMKKVNKKVNNVRFFKSSTHDYLKNLWKEEPRLNQINRKVSLLIFRSMSQSRRPIAYRDCSLQVVNAEKPVSALEPKEAPIECKMLAALSGLMVVLNPLPCDELLSVESLLQVKRWNSPPLGMRFQPQLQKLHSS